MKYHFKPEDYQKLKKHSIIAIAALAVVGVLFYFICGDSLFLTQSETTMPNRACVTEFVPKEMQIVQAFAAQGDQVDGIVLYVTTRGHEKNTDILNISIYDRLGNLAASSKADTSQMQNYSNFRVNFEKSAKTRKGETYFLTIESEAGEENNSIALYYGDIRGYNRYSVDSSICSDRLQFGDEQLDGSLCVSFINTTHHLIGQYYWAAYLLCMVLLILSAGYQLKKAKKDIVTKPLHLYMDIKRYWFLITQLVNRDFKAKYKRSMLGIMWSFLNPLLTMMVQYVVFSTLFKSDTPNYVVYLFTGII